VFHVKLNVRSIVEHLPERQLALLQGYEALLRERAVPMGLVSEADAGRLWDRHVLDSLRGLACLSGPGSQVADLGSGAGLPGIPLAIASPGFRFTLVEPKRRRAAFLESVTQRLELDNVSVAPIRAEDAGFQVDMCLARALAPPVESWRRAVRILARGGRLLYWGGRTWDSGEVERLARSGATAKICLKPEFQWQGPLVIMSSVSTTSPKDDDRA
jgi:16S rRNA (guanine527-N7)-methyltransferase